MVSLGFSLAKLRNDDFPTLRRDELVERVAAFILNEEWTTVSDGVTLLPATVSLHCYPNPFNPLVNLYFDLHSISRVRVDVYNLLGQRITRLMDAPMGPGGQILQWDALGEPSGTYFFQVHIDDRMFIHKIVYLR